MASPQLENGHTRVANELLEAVTRFPFTATQLRLVLWVFRNTHGWGGRRWTLFVGLTKMGEQMKMPRASVALAVSVLVEAGILTEEKGPEGARRFRVNKNYDEWIEQSVGLLKLSNRLDGGSNPLDSKTRKVVSSPLDTSSSPLDTSVQPIGHPYKELKKDLKKDLNSGVKKELTPLQKVIRGFKEAKGIDANDAKWDTLHFKRFARAAQDLLKVFGGSAEAAIVYTLKYGSELDDKHLDGWGLEAVARKAATDPMVQIVINGGESNGSENGQVDADRLDGRGRRSGTARAGEIVGNTLARIGKDAAVPERRVADLAEQQPDSLGDEPDYS